MPYPALETKRYSIRKYNIFHYRNYHMPSYQIHDKINIALLVLILPALIYLNVDFVTVFIFALSFTFGTFFLSPDLDINSKIFKRWKLLRIFWCPYKEIFSHRQLSHHPIFGPISLICYLFALVILVLYVVNADITRVDIRLLIIIAGMVTAIEAHIVTDLIGSVKKKKGKK